MINIHNNTNYYTLVLLMLFLSLVLLLPILFLSRYFHVYCKEPLALAFTAHQASLAEASAPTTEAWRGEGGDCRSGFLRI